MKLDPTPPEGFTFDALLERSTLSEVFRVLRAGEAFVCKRLGDRARADESSLADAEREANVLRALAGRGAPELVDAGTDAFGPFVVTRFVAMDPLARLGAAACAAPRAAFDALAAIHEADDAGGPLAVVHADISPSNLLVAAGAADACFVDFGYSQMRGAPGARGGAFRGTLAFAAPELARGEPIDARADIFALAASLLSVAADEPPRAAGSEAALLAKAGGEPIDAWARAAASRFEPNIGAALVACVAFDREARPARARDVCGT